KKVATLAIAATGLVISAGAAQAECLGAILPADGYQRVQAQWQALSNNGMNMSKQQVISTFNQIVRDAGGQKTMPTITLSATGAAEACWKAQRSHAHIGAARQVEWKNLYHIDDV